MKGVIRGLYLMIFCQVVLESLPISSSGHLVLLEKILQSFGKSPTVADLPDFFDHFLHGPTILVLLLFFRKEWFELFKFLFKNFSFSADSWTDSYKKLLRVFFKICSFIFITTAITVFSYFIFPAVAKALADKWNLKQFDFFKSEIFMLLNFAITAILLFSLYFISKKNLIKNLDYKKVIILGIIQSISFLPGISRFGSTYVASRWMGVSVRRSFQFTFLMQFPLIVAAFSSASFKLLFDTKSLMRLFNFKVGITFFIATILAYLTLYLSYYLAKKQKLWYLGFYMLLPLALLIYFIIF
ncbi:MAG: undecaprenyl-diphosphate phosphatase [bacterium]